MTRPPPNGTDGHGLVDVLPVDQMDAIDCCEDIGRRLGALLYRPADAAPPDLTLTLTWLDMVTEELANIGL